MTGEKKRTRQRRYNKQYRSTHLEEEKERSRIYRNSNKEKIKESNKQWRLNNWEKHKESCRQWKQNNNGRLNEYLKLRLADKQKNDLNYRLNNSVGSMMYHSLKESKSGRHWEELVGYTLQQLKEHLENLFQPGMSWNNYGQWHIDHIIPRSAWKFEKPEYPEFKQCWALCNLQPLWAKDNIRKSNKIITN